MSWLSELTGIHLGNVGAPVGAAIGSIVPGVGTALGAGLGQFLGGVGSGQGVGKSAVQGAGVYGGGKLLGSALGALGGASSGEGAPSDGGGWLQTIENGLGSAGGFLKNAAGSALGAVTGGGSGGGTNPLLLALAAAQTANAAHLGSKADDYAQAATDQYANQAPLRSAGTAGLLTPRPMQDLSGLSAIRSQNPRAR